MTAIEKIAIEKLSEELESFQDETKERARPANEKGQIIINEKFIYSNLQKLRQVIHAIIENQ